MEAKIQHNKWNPLNYPLNYEKISEKYPLKMDYSNEGQNVFIKKKKKLREFTLKKTSLKGKLDIELQISNNNKALWYLNRSFKIQKQ